MEWWEKLKQNETERARYCQVNPYVYLNVGIDWGVGISFPLEEEEREQIETAYFEDKVRPILRESAREHAEEFAALCEKLKKLNRENGRAETITFKLLMDSLLRRVAPPVASSEFQKAYKDWVNICAEPLWAAIESWAIEHGLPASSLTADNILYNVQRNMDTSSILIQPWVAIDLHDYVIEIDCGRGLITKVMPAGKTSTIARTLIRDEVYKMTNPKSLHDRFSEWVRESLEIQTNQEPKEIRPVSEIRTIADVIILRKASESTALATFPENFIEWVLDNMKLQVEPTQTGSASRSTNRNVTKLGALLLLQIAKHRLFQGRVKEAIRIIERIRNSNRAPVYLWEAIAHQFSYVQNTEALSRIGGFKLSNSDLYIVAYELIRKSLSKVIASQPGAERTTSHFLDDSVVLDARIALRKLVAKDQPDYGFINRIVASPVEAYPDRAEHESFDLSPDEGDRYRAAVYALTSLMHLYLAESTKTTARSLPFTGSTTRDIREQLDNLQMIAHGIPFGDSSIAQQLDALAAIFKAT
jgi:hypothetical protein